MSMPLLRTDERHFAQAVSDLVYCNPFLPERMACERRALGEAFVEAPPVWSATEFGALGERPNLGLLRQRTTGLADALRARLLDGGHAPTPDELVLYEDVVLYVLYERIRDDLHEVIERVLAGDRDTSPTASPARSWPGFREGFEHYLGGGLLPGAGPGAGAGPGPGEGLTLPTGHRAEHVFACFFQIRRAFSHIYHYLVGGSMPAAQLRAAVWQSIFTHDFRRYYAGLYDRMADWATLITGESGTGKELVARAIGRSRYIPFDPRRQAFTADFAAAFQPVNLAALSPTLIESELFGHKKGSFTGAGADRAGYLESCPPVGTVFLDEVGELDPAIQVKLLRVLQARTFARLGETAERRFEGKIIAATNRDLGAEIKAGRFRVDFYYRLCSDVIRAPSLREQLAESPDDLPRMLRYIMARLTGGGSTRHTAEQISQWIVANLGRDYPWPGNFRELEQCVRNVLLRGSYAPLRLPDAGPLRPVERLVAAMRDGELSADELLSRYVTLVYSQTGSYLAAAERLGMDRRTVKAKMDEQLLDRLRNGSS